ncbi:MAG: recombinase zinc beta ribbon domain-containing protein, partial [Candidatus Peregrinibacteria bacterium]
KGLTREKVIREKYTRKDGTLTDRRKPIQVPFTRDLIRSILQNKTYIGYRNRGKLMRLTMDDDVHLIPLINDDLFNRVQELIKKNDRGKPANKGQTTSRQKRVYLLQGLIKSNNCGYSMYGAAEKGSNDKMVRRYLCTGRKQGVCKCPSIRADYLEERLLEYMGTLKIKNIDKVETELKNIIKVNANAIKEAMILEKYDNKRKKQLKVLEEIIADNYDWKINEQVESLRTAISEHEASKNSRKSSTVKYYDFIELREVLKDVSATFKRLQELVAKKGLVQIFLKEVLAEKPTASGFSYHSMIFHLKDNGKEQPIKSEYTEEELNEVAELKLLFMRFMGLLFSEVSCEYGKGNDVLNIQMIPTGLFLLLFDKKIDKIELEERESKKLSRKRLISLPAHQKISGLPSCFFDLRGVVAMGLDVLLVVGDFFVDGADG